MPNRAGLPIWAWVAALGAGVLGFMYFRKKSSSSSSTAPGGALTGQPNFSQQQEVQDFQIFSALTSAQQGSDLNFLTEVASLFAGGSSSGMGTSPAPPGTPNPGTPPQPVAPAPPSTGTAPPATKTPGYGTVQTAQGQMIWLGVNQAGQPIYNVGGGAPVYFGNAQALATGSQYEQPGEDIYTPVAYENLVSSNASTLGSAYT